MTFFTNRRKAHLAPALDDIELARVLKALNEVPRAGVAGMANLHVVLISDLLRHTGTDWDRRMHRLSVLAEATADSDIPSTWITREPRHADALLLNAWARLVRGRRSRRLSDAHEVVNSCYRAAELSPKDPTPWVIILGVSRLTRYEHGTVLSVWREAVTRDRWHREAHLQMLGYLSPDEGGSRLQVLEFVDSLRAQAPPDAPTAAVELTASAHQYGNVVAKGGVEALMARNLWHQGPMAQALTEAGGTWPRPGFLRHAAALADLNLLAYALVAADRRAQAAPVFTALRGRVTSWPWEQDGDPVTVFSHAQSRSIR